MLLVGNDHGKHIGRHDRADESADVDEGATAGKDMAEAIGGGNDEHHKRRVASQPVFLPMGERQVPS